LAIIGAKEDDIALVVARAVSVLVERVLMDSPG
jgi:hypothetical protein